MVGYRETSPSTHNDTNRDSDGTCWINPTDTHTTGMSMLHYTRYSGTVVALRGSGQGKGLDLHEPPEKCGTTCREPPPSDMPHNRAREGHPFHPLTYPWVVSVWPYGPDIVGSRA